MRYDQYGIASDVRLGAYVRCRRCGKTGVGDRLDLATLWAEEHELVCEGDDVSEGDDVDT